MATRSPKGTYWDIGGGNFFVPSVDQVGGYNPDSPVLDENGKFVLNESGGLIPMSARPPQTEWSVPEGGGVWKASGVTGTPYTYDGLLEGRGQGPFTGWLYNSQPQESYFASSPDEGFMGSFKYVAPFFAGASLPFLMGGAAGAGTLGSIDAGLGAGAGYGAADVAGGLIPQYGSLAGTAGATTGGGMSGIWDWLEQVGSNFGNPEADNLFGQTGTSGFDPLADYGPSYFEGGQDYTQALKDLSELPAPTNLQDKITGIDSIATKYGLNATNLLKQVLGLGGAGSDAASRGKSLWDQISGDPLGTAFNATPFLLALQQANSQKKDLDSVLSQIDAQGFQRSVLDPYDMQTGQLRTAQTDSLGQRSVLGSSFGDQSLNNFDYMRAMGRGDLASKAGLASAGLQGNLINQRNTNTNLLLGAGLNASGRLFSPQKDPFNLAALLGG